MNLKPPKSLPPAERKIWNATMKAQAKIDKALGFGKTAKPPKFPMKLKEFLRRAFGGRYHGDRLHLYRKYLLEQFIGMQIVEEMYPLIGKADTRPPSDRVDDFIAKVSREGFADSVRCFEKIHDLQQWQKRNKIDQRRKANASRWLKENRKKLLWLLNWRKNALSQSEKCSLASPKSKKSAGSHFKK